MTRNTSFSLILSLTVSYLLLLLSIPFSHQDQHSFGEPWVFNIDAGTVHQYVIAGVNPQQEQFLDIIATPLVGDCDLFVSNTVHDPSSASCEENLGQCRNSTSAHGDIVSLAEDDIVFGQHPIHVGVECLSNAIYMMNAYISEKDDIFFTAQNGLPQVAVVHFPRHYARFRFSMDDYEGEADSFSVSVTPIGNSDPDIFMKWGADADSGDHTWRSNGFKGDVITVKKDDPNFKDNGVYHIAVQGFSPGMFTLSVVVHGTYSRLMESVPLLHSVEKDELRYFTFESRDQKRLMFSVSPTTVGGNPDMYVTDEEGVADNKKPGPDNHKWKSDNPTGIDWITIEDAPAGKYYIGVLGALETTFSIVAYPEHNNIVLLDGVAQERVVNASGIQYYKYYLGDPDSGIQVQVSNLDDTGSTGALDVFMSTSNTHPDGTPGKYEYRSVAIGLQSNLYINERRTTAGTYFIGVKNPSIQSDAPYAIQVSSTQSIQTLHNGQVSLFNTVPKDFYRFYMIELPNRGESDIIISTAVNAGDTDLFVSTEFSKPTKDYCNQHPQVCWRSERAGQDAITISSNDPKITTNTFYVGVLGYRDFNTFDILVYTSGQAIQIAEGESISGSVQTGKYNYFVIPVVTSGTLRVDLQLNDPQSTDADIYFSSTIAKPNQVSCEGTDKCLTGTHFGNDFIETDVIPRAYYIGIHGIAASTKVVGYKLTVSQNMYRITLNSLSALQHVAKEQVKRFEFYVDGTSDYVEVSSTLISGHTTLFLSSNTTEVVGPDNHMWRSDLWPGNIIHLPRSTSGFRRGSWSAAVYGISDSDFYISASGGNQNWHNTMLTLGRPLLFAAPQDEFMYLRFTVCPSCDPNIQAPQDHYLNIEVISGAVNVYVKQGFDRPTADSYTFKSEGGQSRNMVLSKDLLKSGITYIAVKGVLSDAVFSITATSADTPVYITSNHAQKLSFETQQESKYFQLLNAREAQPVTLVLESCRTASPPTIYGSKTENHPKSDPATHDFQSDLQGLYRQKLEVTPPAFSESPVTFVGIQAGGPKQSLSFVSYRHNAVPVIDHDTITGTLDEHNKLTISVAKATPNPRFPDSILNYEVYILDLEVQHEEPAPQNFETVCAIENGNYDGKIEETANEDDTLQYEMKEVDMQKSYMLNVVVRDERGLKTTYTPRFINVGHVMDDFANSCYGILADDKEVCSGRGTCSSPNTCICAAEMGYGGAKCDLPICREYLSDNKDVCGGHGKCVAPEKCECDPGYMGSAGMCSAIGGFNPAFLLIPLFLGGICCCACIFLAFLGLLIFVGWRKYRSKAYASFEDDEDMSYLDNRGEFEEL